MYRSTKDGQQRQMASCAPCAQAKNLHPPVVRGRKPAMMKGRYCSSARGMDQIPSCIFLVAVSSMPSPEGNKALLAQEPTDTSPLRAGHWYDNERFDDARQIRGLTGDRPPMARSSAGQRWCGWSGLGGPHVAPTGIEELAARGMPMPRER
jgi:hypothetical protein